jgi:hypothetical protein
MCFHSRIRSTNFRLWFHRFGLQKRKPWVQSHRKKTMQLSYTEQLMLEDSRCNKCIRPFTPKCKRSSSLAGCRLNLCFTKYKTLEYILSTCTMVSTTWKLGCQVDLNQLAVPHSVSRVSETENYLWHKDWLHTSYPHVHPKTLKISQISTLSICYAIYILMFSILLALFGQINCHE